MCFSDMLQYLGSIFFCIEVTKPQPVQKAEEPSKVDVKEEKAVTPKISPETGRGIGMSKKNILFVEFF